MATTRVHEMNKKIRRPRRGRRVSSPYSIVDAIVSFGVCFSLGMIAWHLVVPLF